MKKTQVKISEKTYLHFMISIQWVCMYNICEVRKLQYTYLKIFSEHRIGVLWWLYCGWYIVVIAVVAVVVNGDGSGGGGGGRGGESGNLNCSFWWLALQKYKYIIRWFKIITKAYKMADRLFYQLNV